MNPLLSQKDIERFWSFVDIRGENECWPWKRAKNEKGYGIFSAQGWNYRAHRIAFFLTYGRVLDNLGCHTCDFPSCCNPKHVFDGSSSDNTSDMIEKGRIVIGSARSQARLTEEDIKQIRLLRNSEGLSYRELGKRFGVSHGPIGRLLRNETWTHVK